MDADTHLRKQIRANESSGKNQSANSLLATVDLEMAKILWSEFATITHPSNRKACLEDISTFLSNTRKYGVPAEKKEASSLQTSADNEMAKLEQ